ncbi:hypothetical protein BDZ89DRAFT_1055663 [Hymenopellis radicata]|nr:hypothetical protein BDZ89DRAFT_1055663 [Hymenopellis radicata]
MTTKSSDNHIRIGTKPTTTATNKPSGVKNTSSVKTSSSSTSKPTDASAGATEPSDTSKSSSAKGVTR